MARPHPSDDAPNPSASASPEKPKGRYRWGICALLFFVITINYIDRQIIGVLKPVIEDDLGWSEVDYGNIVTAFQASYGIGLLVVGRWLDRVGTRKGMAIAIVLWSLAAALHGAVSSVLAFICARITLGLAESAAYPGAVKSVAEWFPKRERALGVGFLNAGANLAVLFTPVIAIGVAGLYGWRAAFLVAGALGFVVLAAWLAFFRQPADHAKVTDEERRWINQDGEDEAGEPLGWKDAIRQRQTWFFICGKFFTDPVWYLFLFWLPDFLAKTQGMELFPKSGSGILSTMGPALIGVYLLADIGSIAGGVAVLASGGPRLDHQPGAQDHAVRRSAVRLADGDCRQRSRTLDGGVADRAGDGGASSVQLEHLHHDRRHVSAARRGDGGGDGRRGGCGRRHPDRTGNRLDAGADRFLRADRDLCGAGLHDRLCRHPAAGAEDGTGADAVSPARRVHARRGLRTAEQESTWPPHRYHVGSVSVP
ncbi:MFS transporter [Porphyrobacter sp. YT40]|uniref:MFS transporter n=1 Tax=Porphyrobacter sp. YT40 TaxID=2547601 RepID=UPI0018F8C8CD|nr:MFS transporter [Porphyrobacter sp. YT40]